MSDLLNRMTSPLKLAAVVIVAGALTSVADGAVYVDLTNTDRGTTTSGNWNNFAQSNSFRYGTTGPYTISTNLVDETGASTGWSLVTNNAGNSSGSAGERYTGGAIGSFAASATIDSFFSAGGSNVSFTFSGLSPTDTYNLAFVSAANAKGDGTPFTTTANTIFAVNGVDVGSINPSTNTGTLVTATDVAPNSSGQIVFTFRGSNGGVGLLNAFSIAAVPEPTSLGVLGVGAAGLLARRRARD